jgi:hypothetical protein
LLSTITGWFQAAVSFSAIRRARMSGAPPGVKVTTMWIGLAELAGWAIAAGAGGDRRGRGERGGKAGER